MKIRTYTIPANIRKEQTLVLAADLHDQPYDGVLRAIQKIRPDRIFVCGDVLNARIGREGIYEERPGSGQHLRDSKYAPGFLSGLPSIAKTYFTTGNHELYFDGEDERQLAEAGIVFLKDDYLHDGELVIGGLTSPYHVLAGTGRSHNKEESDARWAAIFDGVRLSWLDRFEKEPGFKILLCHHPEFYDPYIRPHKKIDLILSGHTHGGQIRLFGKGLFAYGQGFFPKYDGGLYDGRLIVSRGLSNTSRIPRLFNPGELAVVRLVK